MSMLLTPHGALPSATFRMRSIGVAHPLREISAPHIAKTATNPIQLTTSGESHYVSLIREASIGRCEARHMTSRERRMMAENSKQLDSLTPSQGRLPHFEPVIITMLKDYSSCPVQR